MPYRYLDNIAIADAAFEAWGDTVEEMFLAAAEATLGTMVEYIESIRRGREIVIEVEARDVEMLLFFFLEEIVYHKDADRIFIKPDTIVIAQEEIDEDEIKWILEAAAWGDPIDLSHHQLAADVKAVTLHHLKVEETAKGWRATVVLDI